MVNSHHDIEEDDYVSFDNGPYGGHDFRVSDKQVEDIGMTETLGITLVSDPTPDHANAGDAAEKTLAIVGTTSDSQVSVEQVDGDKSWQVFWQEISLVDPDSGPGNGKAKGHDK